MDIADVKRRIEALRCECEAELKARPTDAIAGAAQKLSVASGYVARHATRLSEAARLVGVGDDTSASAGGE